MSIQSALRNPAVQLIVSLLILAITLICINPNNLSILQKFEPYALILSISLLGSGFLFFFFNHNRLMFVCFGSCALLCMVLNDRVHIPLKPAQADDTPLLSISNINLIDTSISVQTIQEEIFEKQPDLVSICFHNSRQTSELTNKMTQLGFIYQKGFPLSLGEEVRLFSKREFHSLNFVQKGKAYAILGILKLNDQPIYKHLAFINTSLPSLEESVESSSFFEEDLDYLIKRVQNLEFPLLMFGQYNKVPWSSDLAKLQSEVGLSISNRNLLVRSTNRIFPNLQVPTEQIFYSNQFKCISFETERLGSTNQFGMFGTYQFNQKAKNPNAFTTSN